MPNWRRSSPSSSNKVRAPKNKRGRRRPPRRVLLLFLLVALGDWVSQIPTGALVAVMITVAVGTFDWKSLKQMKVMPVTETVVMVATVATVAMTHDLSLGVLVGVVLSAVFFARSAGKLLCVERRVSVDGWQIYVVHGELFFVSVEQFIAPFDFREAPARVEIDFTHTHVWDASAIDRVILKLRQGGSLVHTSGLNRISSALLERLAVHDQPGAALSPGH